jgi:hypothetical protein
MYQITNITNDPQQEFLLEIPESSETFRLTLRYKSNLQTWTMDLVYKNTSITNRRLFSSPNVLRQWFKVIPFGLACYTIDNTDPFLLDDFQSRCGIMVLSATEVDRYEQYLSDQKDEAQ